MRGQCRWCPWRVRNLDANANALVNAGVYSLLYPWVYSFTVHMHMHMHVLKSDNLALKHYGHKYSQLIGCLTCRKRIRIDYMDVVVKSIKQFRCRYPINDHIVLEGYSFSGPLATTQFSLQVQMNLWRNHFLEHKCTHAYVNIYTYMYMYVDSQDSQHIVPWHHWDVLLASNSGLICAFWVSCSTLGPKSPKSFKKTKNMSTRFSSCVSFNLSFVTCTTRTGTPGKQ